MSIKHLYVGNFKGICSPSWIEIKPITIFIGANSSGKSSCIHAMASLSQTLKVPNNSAPIVLDDEYANVHLGRFIEVIHSKSYQDTISLGLATEEVSYPEMDGEGEHHKVSSVEATYNFKCSKRTQEIHIDSASIKIGDIEYTLRRSSGDYVAINKKTSAKMTFSLEAGFLLSPESLLRSQSPRDFIPLLHAQSALSKELWATFYLGPFREAPRRKYETRGTSPDEVGPSGESSITMLANETIQTRKRPHLKEVSKWLEQLGLANSVNIKRVGTSDLVDFRLGLDDGTELPIADLGYGLSQILPVLTQCSFAQKNSTLLFEQPEIHLHTKSSRELASVFIETATSKNCNIVIETHSPELVKQFLQELRAGSLNPEDFIFYKVERNEKETNIRQIEIDADEDFDIYENWEKEIST